MIFLATSERIRIYPGPGQEPLEKQQKRRLKGIEGVRLSIKHGLFGDIPIGSGWLKYRNNTLVALPYDLKSDASVQPEHVFPVTQLLEAAGQSLEDVAKVRNPKKFGTYRDYGIKLEIEIEYTNLDREWSCIHLFNLLWPRRPVNFEIRVNHVPSHSVIFEEVIEADRPFWFFWPFGRRQDRSRTARLLFGVSMRVTQHGRRYRLSQSKILKFILFRSFVRLENTIKMFKGYFASFLKTLALIRKRRAAMI